MKRGFISLILKGYFTIDSISRDWDEETSSSITLVYLASEVGLLALTPFVLEITQVEPKDNYPIDDISERSHHPLFLWHYLQENKNKIKRDEANIELAQTEKKSCTLNSVDMFLAQRKRLRPSQNSHLSPLDLPRNEVETMSSWGSQQRNYDELEVLANTFDVKTIAHLKRRSMNKDNRLPTGYEFL